MPTCEQIREALQRELGIDFRSRCNNYRGQDIIEVVPNLTSQELKQLQLSHAHRVQPAFEWYTGQMDAPHAGVAFRLLPRDADNAYVPHAALPDADRQAFDQIRVRLNHHIEKSGVPKGWSGQHPGVLKVLGLHIQPGTLDEFVLRLAASITVCWSSVEHGLLPVEG